jgi:hypothetical protein
VLYLSSIRPHEDHAEREGGGQPDRKDEFEAHDAREPLQEVHS